MASQTTLLGLGALAAVAVGVGVVFVVDGNKTVEPAVVENVTPAVAVTEDAPIDPIAPEPDLADAAQPPKFDTFRVEGDGLFVIAGKAAPGQTVDVMLAGQSVERIVADTSGAFGAVLVLDPSDKARRLGLLADPEGDAIASAETYLVEPFRVVPATLEVPEDPFVVGALTTEGAEQVLATVDVGVPDAPVATSQSDTVPKPQIDNATVLVADEDGVRVIPTDRNLPPEVTNNIALDTITYDPEGEVAIAGRASGDGFVTVYIDNQPVTTSRIVEGGSWQTDLPTVDTGIYTLRIDEVDNEGTVVSRIETPFKREDSETVAAVLAEDTAEDDFDVVVRTVQPGATLWAIAQEELGEGVLYVAVYEANRDLIRDPDLIYPGQVFRVPEVTQ